MRARQRFSDFGKFDEATESRLKSLGVPSDSPQTIMAISIINEMVHMPNTTLVIDDFHLTKSMKITALFRHFVMEMPDDFHIVILTRDTSLKQSVQSIASLTAREFEILTLAAEGIKRDEIAQRLYVSEGTVQTHLHNIYLKLEVSGRTEAIRKAQKLKLI